MDNVQLETTGAVVFHRITPERRCVPLLKLAGLVRSEIVRCCFTAMVTIILWASFEVHPRVIHDIAWRGLILRGSRW